MNKNRIRRCVVPQHARRALENPRQGRGALRGEEIDQARDHADAACAGHVSVREAGPAGLRFGQEHARAADRRNRRSFPTTEKTFDDLKARIAKTVDYVKTFKAGEIDASRRQGRHVPDRAAADHDPERRGVPDRLRAAELLFPRHHRLRHPAPRGCRDRQAGFFGKDVSLFVARMSEAKSGRGPRIALRFMRATPAGITSPKKSYPRV